MVSSYDLVPKHVLLSDSDAKKVAKRFNVTLDRFPKIFESDPQAAKLGSKPGQLIEITRNDGNGNYPYYRYVIKG